MASREYIVEELQEEYLWSIEERVWKRKQNMKWYSFIKSGKFTNYILNFQSDAQKYLETFQILMNLLVQVGKTKNMFDLNRNLHK